MQKWIFAASLVLASFTASAARTINIAMPAGTTELVLTNPSSVSVSYTVTCYNEAGTSVNSYSPSPIAVNGTAKHSVGTLDSGKCAANANPLATSMDANSKPVYACGGANSYANAEQACGTGQRFCFPQVGGCTTLNLYVNNVWIKNEGNHEKDTGSCTWGPIPGSDFIYADGTCSGVSVRRSSSEPNTLWPVLNGSSAGTRGAVCCSSPISAGLCKVTITSSDANAFLASPSFKGGSPF